MNYDMDLAAQLDAYLSDCRSKHFSWGQFDCVLFVADWIKHRTGRDPIADCRGRYQNDRGAYRTLYRATGRLQLVEAASVLLGPPLETPRLACRGDVVAAAVREDNNPSLGLCAGTHAVFVGASGLCARPLLMIDCAWSLPCPQLSL
ncbi:putative NLPC_P60 domain-containing protein [Azospirillaceae bacterium]